MIRGREFSTIKARGELVRWKSRVRVSQHVTQLARCSGKTRDCPLLLWESTTGYAQGRAALRSSRVSAQDPVVSSLSFEFAWTIVREESSSSRRPPNERKKTNVFSLQKKKEKKIVGWCIARPHRANVETEGGEKAAKKLMTYCQP